MYVHEAPAASFIRQLLAHLPARVGVPPEAWSMGAINRKGDRAAGHEFTRFTPRPPGIRLWPCELLWGPTCLASVPCPGSAPGAQGTEGWSQGAPCGVYGGQGGPLRCWATTQPQRRAPQPVSVAAPALGGLRRRLRVRQGDGPWPLCVDQALDAVAPGKGVLTLAESGFPARCPPPLPPG